MGRFARSWNITKATFSVMKKDKELFLFPILSVIFSVLFAIVMIFPTIAAGFVEVIKPGTWQATQWVLLFLLYFGLSFIAVFFNVCVVYTAKTRFKGGDATFKESLSFAFSKIHLIFIWSLVSATVGILLKILDNLAEKAKGAGRMVAKIMVSLLGMGWSIITIFVVPAMVYDNLGPIDAIKKSLRTLRKTWGESLIRVFGLGFAQFIFIIIGIFFAIPLIFLGIVGGTAVLIIMASIIFLYFLTIILVFGIANSVFNTALYEYAETGKVPMGYDEENLKNAFKSQKQTLLH